MARVFGTENLTINGPDGESLSFNQALEITSTEPDGGHITIVAHVIL
jgi:hypothetical protein